MAANSFKRAFGEARSREQYWVGKAILDFTEGLYRLMERRDLSKAELARRLDTSPAYITKVMRGNTNFTVESMTRLARAAEGQLCIHVGGQEDDIRWFDVIGKGRKTRTHPRGEFVEARGAQPLSQVTIDDTDPAAA